MRHTTTPGFKHRRAARAVLALSATLLITASACGSDDDSAADTTAATAATTAATTEETTAATTGETTETTEATSAETTEVVETTEASAADEPVATGATEFDVDRYCAAEVDLERAGATNDPEEDPVGFAQALLAEAVPTRALAPAELVDSFDEAIAALEGTIETGNPEALFAVDTTVFHTYDLEHCGWNVVPVSMQDYHFMGLPETLTAGVTSVEVTNDGSEAHVLVLGKKKDGVTASWEEILSSPEGEGMVEMVGSAFAPPGETGYSVVDLAPGEYMAVCPIPQGTTMETEGSGAPHFTLGMQQIITVS